MKTFLYFLFFTILFLSGGCAKEFIPSVNEQEQLLVVEGLITDQPGVFTVKLSISKPLWKKELAMAVKKSIIWITDDLGNADSLREIKSGVYVTDATRFRGEIGREYILHINTPSEYGGHMYQSLPVKMKPAPSVDSIYYEKRAFVYNSENYEGCEIFLDTRDPSNECRFFRWDFNETWEFHLPYDVVNKVCWVSAKSEGIFIKNTTALAESRITKFPLHLISDPIDKLTVKYSILVNQYSLNEDEYAYWENLKRVMDEVGGLYDIIPANIPNNIVCLDNSDEKVLGYFSVSSVTSKRIFISDHFTGINHLYDDCPTGKLYGTGPIPGLNSVIWVIINGVDENPPNSPYRIVTDKRECGDCRTRGTDLRPSFWK